MGKRDLRKAKKRKEKTTYIKSGENMKENTIALEHKWLKTKLSPEDFEEFRKKFLDVAG